MQTVLRGDPRVTSAQIWDMVENPLKFAKIIPDLLPSLLKVSATMRSIMLSWPQLEQPNGIILEYEIRYYEKEHTGNVLTAKKLCTEKRSSEQESL
ncbi:hypothetical protein E5288_WYG015196 [Bos mutus]|uniref:Fibronectin type-III domain-containing protein n=1 Tax=Bos mutus TaxID=72004 RepID=A0A6B0S1I9_9CETA|nr:hypothetical protein [Bos mutus]